MKPVLAAYRWASNGELIADVAKLYIRDGDIVLDPTSGEGNWWTDFKPTTLIKHDKYKLDGVDFRALPEDDCSIDVVAADPPYIAPGGRATSTITEFNEAYGIGSTLEPKSPEDLRRLIAQGFPEYLRVLKPKGILMQKSMDYITSGNLFPGTKYAIDDAIKAGFRYVDRFEHVGDPGPQPKYDKCRPCKGSGVVADWEGSAVDCVRCDGTGKTERRQVHGRRNLSTLLVFSKPPKRKKVDRGTTQGGLDG